MENYVVYSLFIMMLIDTDLSIAGTCAFKILALSIMASGTLVVLATKSDSLQLMILVGWEFGELCEIFSEKIENYPWTSKTISLLRCFITRR